MTQLQAARYTLRRYTHGTLTKIIKPSARAGFPLIRFFANAIAAFLVYYITHAPPDRNSAFSDNHGNQCANNHPTVDCDFSLSNCFPLADTISSDQSERPALFLSGSLENFDQCKKIANRLEDFVSPHITTKMYIKEPLSHVYFFDFHFGSSSSGKMNAKT